MNAVVFVTIGFVMLAVAGLLLTSRNERNLEADVAAQTVITCDEFSSWEIANNHYRALNETSFEVQFLDSNGNGIPCEGLMPRSQHPSEEFDVICDDFQHRDEAEYFFETHEVPNENNFGLDRDLDGRPCETLPPLDEIRRVMSRLNRIWRVDSEIGIDRDCGDFESWAEANAFFVQSGGPESDPHRLDGDKNGIPCEAFPDAPDHR